MVTIPSIRIMQRAFFEKDAAFDGIFFVGVKTTGIFCRPVCRAKSAKPENIEFFHDSTQAIKHGYRPCKLCKPTDESKPGPLVAKLMTLMDQNPDEKLTGKKLRGLKIDPSTARRQFKQHCGMSFAAYQRKKKMGTAIATISKGKRMIDAQQSAGFESPSGFREAFAKHFGVKTKGAEDVRTLQMKWLTSPLGPMLAIASDEGIVLCDFMDRRSIEIAIERLRKRFASKACPAIISPGDNPHIERLERELKDYFAGKLRNFTVPVTPAGTPFEQRAWDYLKTIPYGESRSYGQQAKALGSPGASRAAGRANGLNFISIVIPCHRVIGATGRLTGYGGGVARKKWLLEHEQKNLNSTQRKSLF